MGHRQNTTPDQRLKWDLENYHKRKEATKGSNYEYWSEKHFKLIEGGYHLYVFSERFSRHIFSNTSTSSEHIAKKAVKKLRQSGNFARIICGYNKNKQRIKMFSVIFKPKIHEK